MKQDTKDSLQIGSGLLLISAAWLTIFFISYAIAKGFFRLLTLGT